MIRVIRVILHERNDPQRIIFSKKDPHICIYDYIYIYVILFLIIVDIASAGNHASTTTKIMAAPCRQQWLQNRLNLPTASAPVPAAFNGVPSHGLLMGTSHGHQSWVVSKCGIS